MYSWDNLIFGNNAENYWNFFKKRQSFEEKKCKNFKFVEKIGKISQFRLISSLLLF